MKFSTLQTGAISILAAVILWLIATWFEDDSRWLPTEPTSQVETQLHGPRADTPVKTGTDVLSCEKSEALLIEDVAAARYCSSNDDCTLFDYGYPIQCMTSVSREQITSLRTAYRRYESSCSYRVYYDCPSGEMERVPVCQNNRCEVELRSSDPLQDATLQHLGIKDP